MRCYFMRGGHIDAVEPLTATDDEGLIEQALQLFTDRGKPKGADGFEVWDMARFVYRFSESTV